MSNNTNPDILVAGMLTLLIVFSAWDTTARAAVWVGIFLVLIVWLSAWENGTLTQFGQQLFSKPGGQTP
jgi:hypothetical protein